MTDAELKRILFANPELAVATEPDERPMPAAAKQWLQADKDKMKATFEALWTLCGGPELKPEHRFDDVRLWRFDFALPAIRVAIELDGGVWTQGRHNRGAGYLEDIEKLNTATMAGWRVVRLGTGQVDIEHVELIVSWVNGLTDSVNILKGS